MALPRQPTLLGPQAADRDRTLAQFLFQQAQRQPVQGPGMLVGNLAQVLAGQNRLQSALGIEEQTRARDRATLASLLPALAPGAPSLPGGQSLADLLVSDSPALQGVGSTLFERSLPRPDENLLSEDAFRQQLDLRTAGRPTTTINVGAEQRAAERQAARAENVVDTIDRVIGRVETEPFKTTGLVGGAIMSAIPGTTAFSVSEDLKTVEAALAFGRLQEMRDESKTGGALGAVSEREIDLLRADIASVRQSQDDQDLLRNLRTVRSRFLDVIHGPVQSVTASQIAGMSDSDLRVWLDSIVKRDAVPSEEQAAAIERRLRDLGF